MAAVLPTPHALRIFPHRGAIDHGVALAPGQAVAADGFFTFETLFAALATPRGRRYVLPWTSHLLLRSVLKEADGWLGRLAPEPGGVAAARRAVFELRRAGLTGQHLDV